jgi:hypothetical protein
VDWLFKRPPHIPFVEVLGKNDRFEVRVTVRVDRPVLGPNLERADGLVTTMLDAKEVLGRELVALFGEDFLIDETPMQSESTHEGHIITYGTDFKRRRRRKD